MQKKDLIPNLEQAAVCGLFCPSCGAFIDTREHPERVEERAREAGRPVEDFQCRGCRSDRLYYFCRENCYMKGCAAEKGIDFCVECAEYPCAELREFQTLRPHRLELWESQQRIGEVGYEQWYREMLEHYACEECDTINSAYDLACRGCGAQPSCGYVKEHLDTMMQFD